MGKPAWPITCIHCGKVTNPGPIDKLMEHVRDRDGWIICKCGERGYIEKKLKNQKGDEREWFHCFIHRVSRLIDDPKNPYQPLAFWISYESPDNPIVAVWFSYYKDLRPKGRLKMGHGPGGPPVVDISQIYGLAEELKRQGL